MNNNFLECLEHIIEIEKNCHTQEKLIVMMDNTIRTLGVPKRLNVPHKEQTYVPPVQYDLVAKPCSPDSEEYSGAAFGGAMILGIIGAFVTSDVWSGIIGGAILGAIAGVLLLFTMYSVRKSNAEQANEKARAAAQAKADRLVREQNRIDEENYQKECKKYHALVEFEKVRLINEEEKKKELFYSKNELIQKNNETKALLERFYEFSGIYETYRNIVAICHIYEYFKSGICSELTGKDGAYFVFKYEMYEKQKIEKLDTIISKLDQLHFDNLTLNSTMQSIRVKCENLISEVSDMKASQIEIAKQNQEALSNVGKQIESATNCISYQNAVIAYNQECTNSELKQIKWLSVLERS